MNAADNNIAKLPELNGLQNIKEIDISFNNITTLSDGFCKLQSLEKLDAQNNKISILPTKIGNLTNLKIINFNGNNISQIPQSAENMQQLEELYFAQNVLTTFPDYFLNFANLTIIDISGNELADNEIEKIKANKKINQLKL